MPKAYNSTPIIHCTVGSMLSVTTITNKQMQDVRVKLILTDIHPQTDTHPQADTSCRQTLCHGPFVTS